MGNLNSKRMRFFLALNAVIIISFIYASFSTKEILPRKHVHSVGYPPMRRRIEHRSTSKSYNSTIGNYKRTERSNKPEENEASLLYSNIEASRSMSTYSNQPQKLKLQKQLSKYPRHGFAFAHQKSTRPVTIVSSINGSSSIQTSSAAPALPLPTTVLTMEVYEPGHLNEDIDMQRICMHKGVFLRLLILITSAQSHFMARMSIRQTWMHYASRRDVGMAFVLGSTANVTLNESINQENNIYRDMIRGHFIDSYFNLTLKTISMLEWTDTQCPSVKFILKTDDDMFINVPKLLDFVDARHEDMRSIYGRLAKYWRPVRNRKSKYFVSHKSYSGMQYPPFTTGPAYLLTGDIVHELYMQSLHTYYMQLEDVFITGIVAKSLKIKRVQAKDFRNSRISLVPCTIRNAISVHMIKPSEQYNLWRSLLDTTIKCK
ncbi:beta-1,3-galactosyltransferase 5-like isoform X1 [Drosophila obscura]|uniref:beta-1,3-galactosyltransferase 5-like isoform X1 n=1 Tax=Drosophila obscura TaxID=7282 RepID=UPI001BB25D1B|nr:beta-1,3-galactosyltransferase 5-like isoform X1 [Drosophila obscura]XP_041452278.1 beta-1,3-galactosyltransferase 5-like isoform X1 [Drosophila obscura]XP_041452279.1 beta-1,3-galactosyltransferase 5-like isoform X1 [Drosophila obscura]XP_041452280.1 beta-1,3-galactosyltransferase 5-like isoform X1 [Drosophila obscura]